MFRRWVTPFLAMLCTVLGAHTVTDAGSADLADIQTVANWIDSLQYTDPNLPSYGAIKNHHDPGHYGPDPYYLVVPYFVNLAVVGLLQAPVEGKLEVAERWITWYLGHLNMDDTLSVVYDHWYLADGTGETTCPPGFPSARCDYDDASDSYAATFLGAAWTYYEAGGRAVFLNAPGNKEKFEAIAEVILTLQEMRSRWSLRLPRGALLESSRLYDAISTMPQSRT